MVKKQPQKRKINPLFIRIFLIVTAIAFLIFVFVTGPRGTWKLYKSEQDKQNLLDEIEALETKKAELDSERTLLLNDEEYIEKVAREQYNMKKKGEKVYSIDKDSDQ